MKQNVDVSRLQSNFVNVLQCLGLLFFIIINRPLRPTAVLLLVQKTVSYSVRIGLENGLCKISRKSVQKIIDGANHVTCDPGPG